MKVRLSLFSASCSWLGCICVRTSIIIILCCGRGNILHQWEMGYDKFNTPTPAFIHLLSSPPSTGTSLPTP